MSGVECVDGGREEATEERARGWKGRKQGRLRWGQRRGRWEVRECGVEMEWRMGGF
jgi:hypothetical protein